MLNKSKVNGVKLAFFMSFNVYSNVSKQNLYVIGASIQIIS